MHYPVTPICRECGKIIGITQLAEYQEVPEAMAFSVPRYHYSRQYLRAVIFADPHNCKDDCMATPNQDRINEEYLPLMGVKPDRRTEKMTTRGNILREAAALTEGDRNASYGDPHTNLTVFAELVQAYLKGTGWMGPAMDSVDGSVIMELAKVSRVSVNKFHMDNYKDGAAYMAIAGECSEKVRALKTADVYKLKED